MITDDYYNGARAVQRKAYTAADRRLLDAIAVTEDRDTKTVLIAIWRGVLADIVNAGDEVLAEYTEEVDL